jgi:hypothetical protein
MVLATGSLPPRTLPSYPPGSLPRSEHVRIQVYAQRNVLEKISTVYDGEVWPELGAWASRTIPPRDMGLDVNLRSGLNGIKNWLNGVLGRLMHVQGDGDGVRDESGGGVDEEDGGESAGMGRQEPVREAYAPLEGIGIQYCP